jgi:hypothetical protein
MAIIYLDQWVYVELLRSYKGLPPQYPKYAKICQDLIESSNDGTNKLGPVFTRAQYSFSDDS